MGKLTTHVLNTADGIPGAGIKVSLYKLGQAREKVLDTVTNSDGRCDKPILEGDALKPGVYELEFAAGDYFRSQGKALPEPLFVDVVVLRFGIANAAQHYHVPLLVSPWSYSTYRGS